MSCVSALHINNSASAPTLTNEAGERFGLGFNPVRHAGIALENALPTGSV